MSQDLFRFKQFTIHHDRCAMKVGTDGVLLGAWGCVEGKRILDIGTGTGLIALMAAQRNPEAEVLGIDIDEAAVEQAKENILFSAFNSQCSILKQDVLTFNPESRFDAILCNPPFFTEDTLPDDKGRALARNNKSLPFEKLIPKVASLLADKGTFSLIIPSWLATEVVGLCLEHGLHLIRRCQVHTTKQKPPRRAMMMFSLDNRLNKNNQEVLILMAEDGTRSQAYQELTKDFYL
jgi:tRNA1Val (adenine37-N6)-methyltransferase